MTEAAHIPAFRKPNATRQARRLRYIAEGLRADLGHMPNTGEAALIDQVAALIVQRESLSAAQMRGESIDAAQIVKISGVVARCLSALRVKATNRPQVPPLSMRERILRDRAAP
ncbi:hypothetical protein [Bradyrhizobium sp. DASA03120]|uniref:hypothetical protein n=1 Tax=Bradyrhizobium sp. SMVTL-02 TaxID=3395917 RepID=UPI003F6F8022